MTTIEAESPVGRMVFVPELGAWGEIESVEDGCYRVRISGRHDDVRSLERDEFRILEGQKEGAWST